jgi:hypothetical protein
MIKLDCDSQSYYLANYLSFEMSLYQNGIARFLIDEPYAVKDRFRISSMGVGVEEAQLKPLHRHLKKYTQI